MFIGEYQHTLDTKGRIVLPVKFRDELGSSFIVTKGLDNCLFVYTQEEWKIFEGKVKNLPLTSVEARRFVRFFFSGATACDLDSQSRISIPQNLREYASLNKEIVSIGVSNRIEIWDKFKWNDYNYESNFVDSELAAKMAELGI